MQLGNQFRLFIAETSTIDTVELPREAQKRERDAARKKDGKKTYSGNSQKPFAAGPTPPAATSGGSSSEGGSPPTAPAEDLESILPSHSNTPAPNQPQSAVAKRGRGRGRGRGSTRGRGRGSTRGRGGNVSGGRGTTSQPSAGNDPHFESPLSTAARSVSQTSSSSTTVPIPTASYPTSSCERSRMDKRNETQQADASESPAAVPRGVAALAPSDGAHASSLQTCGSWEDLGVGIPDAVPGDVQPGTEVSVDSSTKRRRAKRMNISTIKFHTLGHYPSTIRSLGPTDLYSTEWVSRS